MRLLLIGGLGYIGFTVVETIRTSKSYNCAQTITLKIVSARTDLYQPNIPPPMDSTGPSIVTLRRSLTHWPDSKIMDEMTVSPSNQCRTTMMPEG